MFVKRVNFLVIKSYESGFGLNELIRGIEFEKFDEEYERHELIVYGEICDRWIVLGE